MAARIALALAILAGAAVLSCDAFAAVDFYAAINRLRAGEGACASGAKQPPLTRQPALERAALSVALGRTLQESIKASGYRATRSSVISVTGSGLSERTLAQLGPGYCQKLLDPAFGEIGIHQDERHLWIVLAAPFAPQVALSPEAAAQRVLQLTNDARAQARNCGGRSFAPAPPLRWNDILARAAQTHADDMAGQNYFSHDGRDGSTPAQRVLRAGYKYRAVGENIAAGQTTPEEAIASWLKSPGHCANLMNPAYSEMGTAYAVENNSELGVYWTQAFGARR